MGDENVHKLYIRLPVKIKDEFSVKELHDNIIKVYLPRQKSRRWCIVEFESKEKLEEARRDLKKTIVGERFVKVLPFKKGKSKRVKDSENSAKSLIKLLENDQ